MVIFLYLIIRIRSTNRATKSLTHYQRNDERDRPLVSRFGKRWREREVK